MSRYVKIGDPSDIVVVGDACSIIFLIDLSASNTDFNGIRFNVVKWVKKQL